ncbi:MAG: mycothiol transferase [Nocardioides sp.]|jgi:uncharacterized damage-inducible protein DinB
MTPIDVLDDAFQRVLQTGTSAVEGLTAEQLAHRPGPDANPIGWLVWHLARVQDDHVADVAGTEQVWTEHGFAGRFDLPFDESAIGFGQTSREVGQVHVEADLLTEYLRAVHDRTRSYLATLTADDLERVVDTRWDPPVTLGVRLVSVVSDDLQHAGQAAYVRGLLGV